MILKVKAQKWGYGPGLSGGPSVIIGSLEEGGGRVRVRDRGGILQADTLRIEPSMQVASSSWKRLGTNFP